VVEQQDERPLRLPKLSDLARDDFSVADRFKADHGKRVRYCHKLKSWFIWDDVRWVEDEVEEQRVLMRETIELMRQDAASIPDEKKAREILEKVNACRSAKKVNAALQTARADLKVKVTELDTHHWLLTCRNVTINLQTGEPEKHDPRSMITKLAPVVYDPKADYPLLRQFLAETFPDQQATISFAQRWAGYCLTGSTTEHVMLFCYGTGANGKSVLMNTLRRVVGSYGSAASPEILLSNDSGNEKHPADIADLRGRRLVITSEPDPGKKISESRLKVLVSSDPIKARFMKENWFEFDPTHKLMLAANHKPRIRSTDPGTWRRILVLPFENTIPLERRDHMLEEKLWSERSGILNWMLKGLYEYRELGLDPPLEVLGAAAEYRREQDILGYFVATMDAKVIVQSSLLYDMYKDWCGEQGMKHQLTLTKFGTLMKERADVIHETDREGRVVYKRREKR
jgi:putative DNA primase/helicase